MEHHVLLRRNFHQLCFGGRKRRSRLGCQSPNSVIRLLVVGKETIRPFTSPMLSLRRFEPSTSGGARGHIFLSQCFWTMRRTTGFVPRFELLTAIRFTNDPRKGYGQVCIHSVDVAETTAVAVAVWGKGYAEAEDRVGEGMRARARCSAARRRPMSRSSHSQSAYHNCRYAGYSHYNVAPHHLT